MAKPPDRRQPDEIEDLSELAQKSEESGVVEVSGISELDWDDDEAATRIDPRSLAPGAEEIRSDFQDTMIAPAPTAESSRPKPAAARPAVAREAARGPKPTLLGVAAYIPPQEPRPVQAFAPTVEVATPAPDLLAPISAPAPVSPFLQVADPAVPSAVSFPETGFEEGVPPDFEAAAAARLAASPVFQEPASAPVGVEPNTAELGTADIIVPRSPSTVLAIVAGIAVGIILIGVIAYALLFSKGPGNVVVRTTIPGATVTVDGQPLSGNPGFFVAGELDPGPHTFTLTAPGMAPVTQIIQVEPDRTIDAPVDLGVGGTASPATATALTASPEPGLSPVPDTATGAPSSAAPATAAAVATPSTVAAAESTPEPRTPRPNPTLQALQKRPATSRPQAEPAAGGEGFLTVQTTPWAKVSVDGRSLGNTPILHHALRAGRHTVSMVNEELGVRQSQRVTITEGQETRIVRNLNP